MTIKKFFLFLLLTFIGRTTHTSFLSFVEIGNAGQLSQAAGQLALGVLKGIETHLDIKRFQRILKSTSQNEDDQKLAGQHRIVIAKIKKDLNQITNTGDDLYTLKNCYEYWKQAHLSNIEDFKQVIAENSYLGGNYGKCIKLLLVGPLLTGSNRVVKEFVGSTIPELFSEITYETGVKKQLPSGYDVLTVAVEYTLLSYIATPAVIYAMKYFLTPVLKQMLGRFGIKINERNRNYKYLKRWLEGGMIKVFLARNQAAY